MKLPLARTPSARVEENSPPSAAKSFNSEISLVGRIVLQGMLGSDIGPIPLQNGVEAMRAAAAKLSDAML